jgi:hypothetical protein
LVEAPLAKFGRSSCQSALAFRTFFTRGGRIAHLIDLSPGKLLCVFGTVSNERSLLSVESMSDLDQTADGFGAGWASFLSNHPAIPARDRFGQTDADKKDRGQSPVGLSVFVLQKISALPPSMVDHRYMGIKGSNNDPQGTNKMARDRREIDGWIGTRWSQASHPREQLAASRQYP